MAQTERTSATSGGMRDGVGIEKLPNWVSARLLADSDGERRLHEGAHGTLHVGAGGKRDLEVGLKHTARLDALALGGHGIGRRVRRLPPIVDFDTGALAGVAKGDRRRERGASIGEGL